MNSSSSSLLQFLLFHDLRLSSLSTSSLCCNCYCFIPPLVFSCGCFITSFSMFLGCCFNLSFCLRLRLLHCVLLRAHWLLRVRLLSACMLVLSYQFSARFFFHVHGGALRIWCFHISLLSSIFGSILGVFLLLVLESRIAPQLIHDQLPCVLCHLLQRLYFMSSTSHSPRCSPAASLHF